MDQPWIVACVLMLIGYAAALAGWPLLSARARVRAAIYSLLAIVILATPILLVAIVGRGHEGLPFRIGVTLFCPVFAVSLLDLHVGSADWKRRSLGAYALFLINPYVLVYRSHVREPARPRSECMRLIARGAVEMTIGIALLVWALTTGALGGSFWLNHAVILIASYLAAFDGLFVFITGMLRLIGCNVLDYSREPVLAATPADFWRRYNRGAGLLFHEDVFKPANGRRRPRRAIMLSFLLNGAYHEYLATVLIGRVMGYQLAFFTIHGLAVALTYRSRPMRWSPAVTVLSRAGTIGLLYVSTILFFTSVDQIQPGWLYAAPSPLRQ